MELALRKVVLDLALLVKLLLLLLLLLLLGETSMSEISRSLPHDFTILLSLFILLLLLLLYPLPLLSVLVRKPHSKPQRR